MQGHVKLSARPCTIFSKVKSETLDRSSSAQQVDDENDQGYYRQQMDQSACDVHAETQEPQNQKHHKYCPKHSQSPYFKVATVPGGSEISAALSDLRFVAVRGRCVAAKPT